MRLLLKQLRISAYLPICRQQMQTMARFSRWLARLPCNQADSTGNLQTLVDSCMPCCQVSSPKCSFEGAEDLLKGCSAQLQGLSAAAAGSVDLPTSLLLSGWLQRYCFTYAFCMYACMYVCKYIGVLRASSVYAVNCLQLG